MADQIFGIQKTTSIRSEDEWLGDDRYGERQDLENLLLQSRWVHYVNPQGPNANPDPLSVLKTSVKHLVEWP